MGKITLGLFGDVAPKTVANFVALANGFGDDQNPGFKGTIFHRCGRSRSVQAADARLGLRWCMIAPG